jgi:hypothetical protein
VNTAGLAPRVFVPKATTVALAGMEKRADDSEGMAIGGTIWTGGTGIAMGEGAKVVRTSCWALAYVQAEMERAERMGKVGGERTGPRLAIAVAATVPWCTSVMKLVRVEISSTARVAASCGMTTTLGITTTVDIRWGAMTTIGVS